MVVATVAVTIVTVCSWFSFVVDCTSLDTLIVSSFTPPFLSVEIAVTTEPLTVTESADGIDIFADTFPVVWMPESSPHESEEEIEGRDLFDCESDMFSLLFFKVGSFVILLLSVSSLFLRVVQIDTLIERRKRISIGAY